MENRTEIGKAIRDRLENLDKNPNDMVWSKIEKDLNRKRKKRILAWLIPSLIVFVFSSTALFLNSDNPTKNQAQQTQPKKETNEKTPNSNQKTNQKLTIQKTEPDKTTTITKTKNVTLVKESSKLITTTNEYEEYEVVKKYKVIIKKQQVKTIPVKTAKNVAKTAPKNNSKKQSNYLLAKNTSNKKTKTGNLKQSKKQENKLPVPFIPEKTTPDALKNSITETTPSEPKMDTKIDTIIKKDSLIAQNKVTPKRAYKKTEYKTQTNDLKPTLSIHAFYGPTIFGSLNGKSMLSPTMDNLSKSHPITSHYGVYVKTMFDKFGFRVGFSKINLKVTTQLDQNLITDFKNINLTSQTNIKDTYGTSTNVELLQKLSYYEVPIAFNYALKKDESKFGIDAFTGFSFMLVDKNALYLKSEKVESRTIGEAKNISHLNVSYDLGIGIEYKLTDKIGLDVNPLFKYYLNTFTENGEAKPYSLSLQTGINYKF